MSVQSPGSNYQLTTTDMQQLLQSLTGGDTGQKTGGTSSPLFEMMKGILPESMIAQCSTVLSSLSIGGLQGLLTATLFAKVLSAMGLSTVSNPELTPANTESKPGETTFAERTLKLLTLLATIEDLKSQNGIETLKNRELDLKASAEKRLKDLGESLTKLKELQAQAEMFEKVDGWVDKGSQYLLKAANAAQHGGFFGRLMAQHYLAKAQMYITTAANAMGGMDKLMNAMFGDNVAAKTLFSAGFGMAMSCRTSGFFSTIFAGHGKNAMLASLKPLLQGMAQMAHMANLGSGLAIAGIKAEIANVKQQIADATSQVNQSNAKLANLAVAQGINDAIIEMLEQLAEQLFNELIGLRDDAQQVLKDVGGAVVGAQVSIQGTVAM